MKMESYPISSFILGLNLAQFQDEVLAQLPLTHITSDGTTLDMYFNVVLNPSQQAILANLVATHNPNQKVGSNPPVLNNLDATRDPNANDDVSHGYTKGSSWMYNNREWCCLNPNYPALWVLRTPVLSSFYKVNVNTTSFSPVLTTYNPKPNLVINLDVSGSNFDITDGTSTQSILSSGQHEVIFANTGLITLSVKKNGVFNPIINSITIS